MKTWSPRSSIHFTFRFSIVNGLEGVERESSLSLPPLCNIFTQTQPVKLTPLLCLGVVICGLGSVPVFIRYLAQLLDAWTVNGIRYAVASLCWLPLLFIVHRRGDWPPGLWRAALIPAAVNLLGQMLWGLSPYYNTAPVNAFAVRISFLFTIVFGFLLLPDERGLVRRPWFWIGAAGCVAGVALLFLENGVLPTDVSLMGGLLIVGCSCCFGGYTVAVRRCLADYPARISFAVVSLYTATGLLVAMLWQGDYTAVAALSGKNWLLLIASAVVGIAVTHVALYRALQQIGALSCTGGLNLSPVIALVLAWVFLGETMTSTQYGGAICLLVAVTALLYAQATVKEKSSEPSA